jgi:tRNA U34 2-thiouridine synthase MnmA/TrmU
MKTKAIVLCSGGLDSTLTLHLLKSLGVELVVLFIELPFYDSEKALEIVRKNAEDVGAKLRVAEVGEEYLQILKNPKYGFGKAVNPCIDCRAFMLKIAKRVMEEEKANFIATGEVLGERPFSQNLEAFKIVEKEASVKNLVLRPLSAKLLPETLAEKKGLIDREKLLDIRGRSRKRQLELAKKFNIKNFLPPAGGCILTEVAFKKRFEDLKKYNPNFSLKDLLLLKYGRHFRVSKNCKILLGRNEEENKKIFEIVDKNDILFEVLEGKGPLGVYFGPVQEEILEIVASIIISYSKCEEKAKVKFWNKESFEKIVEAKRMERKEARKFLIN